MDYLERVLARLLLLADRHAAAVVSVRDAAIGVDGQLDMRGVAGHRLVDRVIDDLPDQMVKAAPVGRADVHARPAPNCLKTLEDLDALCRVRRRTRLRVRTRLPAVAVTVGCRRRWLLHD